MTKPRATTIQQRFGFKDGDLKTPLHDEILLWLDENIQDVVKELIGWNPMWERSTINACKSKIAKKGGDLLSEYPMPEKPDSSADRWYQGQYERQKEEHDSASTWSMPEVPGEKPEVEIQTRWEFPISTQSRNKFVIGFIDMYVQIVYATCLSCVLEEYRDCSVKLPTYRVGNEHKVFYFEIKTTIPSLGELVRQIRFYQEYAQGEFIVVCPDDRFKKPLASQGIGFLQYERGQMGLDF